jgi:NTP pyrophosphatase (non-canonical NTP hydrolase)
MTVSTKDGRSMSQNSLNTTLNDLTSQVRLFLKEREWEKYQNPKDLAESICIEAAELLEVFQWVRTEESEQFKNKPQKAQRIKEELADVLIYCLGMASTLNIDLTVAVLEKVEHNKKKYPVEQYRGKANFDT